MSESPSAPTDLSWILNPLGEERDRGFGFVALGMQRVQLHPR